MKESIGNLVKVHHGTDLGTRLVSGRLIPRPRLDELFAVSLNQTGGVLWVVAGAGAGKSAQAESFARSTTAPVSWVRLGPERPTSAYVAELFAAALQGEGPGLIVVDDCHLLFGEPATLTLLADLRMSVRRGWRVILLTRDEPPQELTHLAIRDSDLAMSVDEIRTFATARGGDASQAEEISRATGGWALGVLLHTQAASAEAEAAVAEYLASEVLDQLPEDEQRVLLAASVAPRATAHLAEVLCGEPMEDAWDRLTRRHLPTINVRGAELAFTPVLRAALRYQRLSRRPGHHTELVRRYATYLGWMGQAVEAVELLLAENDQAEAVRVAEQAVPELQARREWRTLEKLTNALGEAATGASNILLGARIHALNAAHQFARARFLVRTVEAGGRLPAVLAQDAGLVASAAAVMLPDAAAATRLLDLHGGDHRKEAVRFLVEVSCGESPAEPPQGDDWDLHEQSLSWALFVQGRIGDITRLAPGDGRPLYNPDVVLAYAYTGRLPLARRMWSRIPHEVRVTAHARFAESLLVYAEGDRDHALELLEDTVAEGRRMGSFLTPYYEAMTAMALMRHHRAESARALLEDRVRRWARGDDAAVLEWGRMLLGWSYLEAGRNEKARALLVEAVDGMHRAGRHLQLPLAAACLAEAHARCGDLDASHRAAAMAYDVASSTGFFLGLVRAAWCYPDIQRREQARDRQDTRWRRLVVCPSAPAVPKRRRLGPAMVELHVQTFGGRPDLVLDGRALGVGRLKVIELVACLALHPGGVVRTELQRLLLPEADAGTGGNHFRQIMHKFRDATGIRLVSTDDGWVKVPGDASIYAADQLFEQEAAFARGLHVNARLPQLQAALSLVTGQYLGRSELTWVVERREHLEVVREEAQLEVVRLLIEGGRLEEARQESEDVLGRNRYCDPAYRLLAYIEKTAGAEETAYRRAASALGELGLRPGDTRRFLELGASGSIT
ncbi:hypothetical protein GCM10009555_061820 [Acrocarpospora macrocephala]|uniref:MalT-like winged helix domain-containing protein n=1 Tax=Acrocarpospora macrocephala TaxID=150177 RepID=A0A5M3WK83_9ACTN|nr:hypothetical protein [Acrocarpospora macrocephala]GES09625.1 hypothetical protein Amac_032210 [Acrocarpospora macrocephala]